MKYAIIAAGEGSRLSQEGVNEPKPLVKVNGEHLIDRLIRVFMSLDAEEIVVICNDLTTLVRPPCCPGNTAELSKADIIFTCPLGVFKPQGFSKSLPIKIIPPRGPRNVLCVVEVTM